MTKLSASLVVLAVLFAGCGDDGSESTEGPAPPEPQQSIEEFTTEFEQAAAEAADGDCEAYTALYKEGLLPPDACEVIQVEVGDLEVGESAEYGTGATFDYTGPEFARGDNVVALVGLDAEGEWRFSGGLTTDAPSVGTEAESTESFGQAMDDYMSSIRDEDCDLYFRVALTPAGQSKADACKVQFESPFIEVIQDNPDAQPESLGGNAYLQVYGLTLPEHYFTFEVFTGPTPEDRALVAATFLGAGEDLADPPAAEDQAADE